MGLALFEYQTETLISKINRNIRSGKNQDLLDFPVDYNSPSTIISHPLQTFLEIIKEQNGNQPKPLCVSG